MRQRTLADEGFGKYPQQVLGIEAALVTQHTAKGVVEPQLLPQGGQQPGIAYRPCRRESGLAGAFIKAGLAGDPQKAIEQDVRAAGLKPQGIWRATTRFLPEGRLTL